MNLAIAPIIHLKSATTMPNQEDHTNNPFSDQLSNFQFGPAWARETKPVKQTNHSKSPNKPNASHGISSKKSPRNSPFGQDRSTRDSHRDNKRRRNQDRTPPPERPAPTSGVTLEIRPCKTALEAICSQIKKSAHTYPLFTLAKFVVSERPRYRLYFESSTEGPVLFSGLLSPSLFTSKSDAIASIWSSGLVDKLYNSIEVEVEQPSGNFPAVARCPLTQTLLGPPNHHNYPLELAKLHREKFPSLSLATVKGRIELIHDQEVIDQWLNQMSKATHYTPIHPNPIASQAPPSEISTVAPAPETAASDQPDTPAILAETNEGTPPSPFNANSPITLKSPEEVERHFAEHFFDLAFASGHQFSIPGDVAANHLSPGLLEHVREQVNNARKKPNLIIPNLCKTLTHHHVAVFRWQKKLYAGPSRPHPIPLDVAIADRPAKIISRTIEEPGIKFQNIVEEITGTQIDDPSAEELRAELLKDLRWLLTQGYALYTEGGHLHIPKKPIKDRPKQEQESHIKGIANQNNPTQKSSPNMSIPAPIESLPTITTPKNITSPEP